VSRRGFLGAAGALVIGLALPGCQPARPAAALAARTGEFMPNAWLRIGPDDRITFVLDRVEMGQGTMTSHVTLLAEELEVDPRTIHVEHASAGHEYDNPSLGFQVTGGSNSTASSWEPLRRAGATAREMLRRAAAERWNVPIESCAAVDGAIVHAASGQKARYGALTREAARLPLPEGVALKPPASFRWIGTAIGRLDARAKVDGSAVFGLDVKVEGMLFAVVLRPPVAGGRLVSFAAEEARALPGVVDIYAVPSGIAVVADRSYRARTAAARVTVTWDAGPLGSLDSAALAASYAARARKPAPKVRHDGNFPEAKARAKQVVRAEYAVPYLAHATMEPMNCTAHVTRERCEVWAPTQSAGLARELIQKEIGLPYEAIEIHTTFLGGGFGRRLQQDYVIEAVHVSRKLGRPVKVVWSREDDLTHDFYRPASHGLLEGTLDEQGRLTGWFHRIVGQSIVAQIGKSWVNAILPGTMPQALKVLMGRTASALYEGGAIHDASSSEGAADFAYAIPHLQVEYAQVEPGVPVGFWRSVGNSENVFIVESFLDELAHAAGRDPYTFRRELLAGSPRHLATLDLAASRAGWGTPAPPGVFRGIAQCKCFGTHAAQVVEITVEGGALHVTRVVAAVDCGRVINPDLVRAQVESSIVFGLSAALRQQITLAKGQVQETNFHQFGLLRMHESPRVEVHLMPSEEPPSGVGEPGLPPLAPALGNAIFAATGRRVRSLPIEPWWKDKA
jgi:CO/xanthine dehydrogenase Mo-binding subunit